MSILFDYDEDPTQSKHRYSQKNQERKQVTSKYDDLLMFGYHCKLFRDSITAEDVNRGKYLIPWMGNKDLLIDRYDCRGHLYRLEEFDFKHFPVKSQGLSTEEMDVENVCDEERYKDMSKDMIEENILEEEEEKRSQALYDPHTAYQSIGYSYGDNNSNGKSLSEYTFNNNAYIQYCQYYGYDPEDPNIKAYFQGQASQYDYERPPPPSEPPVLETVENSKPAELEKFEPPEGLDIPENLEVPETRKMQSIIDKTALFISKQSGQMEIVLKTKQSGNPQFAFLTFDNYLNPYYKFILKKIKDGTYKPAAEETSKDEAEKKEATSDNEASDDDDDDGELHPLLQAHRRPLPKKEAPPAKPVKEAYIPKTKMTGRVEDLAKVYFSMKYSAQNEPEVIKEETLPIQDNFYDSPYNSFVDSNAQSGGIAQSEPPYYNMQDQSYQSQYSMPGQHNQPPPPPSNILPRPQHMFPHARPPPSHSTSAQNTSFMSQPVSQVPPNAFFSQRQNLPEQPIMQRLPRESPFPPENVPAPQAIPQHILLPPGVDVQPVVQSFQQPLIPNLQRPMMPPPQGIPAVGPRQPYVDMIPRVSLSQPSVITPYNQIPVVAQPGLHGAVEMGLLPPGVDLETPESVDKSCLPPPPPLPPPPSINNIKTRALTDASTLPSVPPVSESVEISPANSPDRNVNQDQNRRYEPSPLLSQILKSRTISRDTSQDYSTSQNNTYTEETESSRLSEYQSSPRSDTNQSYVLHPDTHSAYGRPSEINIDESNSPLSYEMTHSDSPYNNSTQQHEYQSDNYAESELDERQFSVVGQPVSYLTPVVEPHLLPHQDASIAQPPSYYQRSLETAPNQTVSPFDIIQKTLQQFQPSVPKTPIVDTIPQQVPDTGEVLPPSSDLQDVIDRLALYVAKNGDEFEAGIKEKNDPRFDFLNPWNMYHKYYIQKKEENVEEIEKQKIEDEERRKNLKVSFGLKTKVKPVTVAKRKTVPTAVAIFNQNDDEDEDEEVEASLKDGFQPNKERESEMKKKLQKQIEEKEKLLRQLQEQALLQHKISEVNRQAGRSHSTLTPQQQAHLKRKIQTDNLKKEDTSSSSKEVQDKRRRKAASFVGMLKRSNASGNTSEDSQDDDGAGEFLRKRHFKETDDEPVGESISSNKKDAFFQAINQAFKTK